MTNSERAESLNTRIKIGDVALRDEYQTDIHFDTIEHCKKSNAPAFVEASVGAGKSLQIAFFADHVSRLGGRVLSLARQGELTEQNSQETWMIGCKNSIYSNSLQQKSLHYPVVFGTEGTVARALRTDFNGWIPDCILIDECLTGDSLINTELGLVKISDPKLEGLRIKCIDTKSGEVFYHKPVRVFSNGVRPTISIRTKFGSEIKCTKNHKIFTENSWVESRYLKVGQKIRLEDSQSGVLTKCLRASAAVVKRLGSILAVKIGL